MFDTTSNIGSQFVNPSRSSSRDRFFMERPGSVSFAILCLLSR